MSALFRLLKAFAMDFYKGGAMSPLNMNVAFYTGCVITVSCFIQRMCHHRIMTFGCIMRRTTVMVKDDIISKSHTLNLFLICTVFTGIVQLQRHETH